MRMTLQAIALLLTLMLGIVLGIGTAETNIQKIQGSQGAPRAVQISPDEDGQVEIAVLGKVYETEHPVTVEKVKEKTQKVQEAKKEIEAGSSWLADAGNQAGDGVRKAARKMVDTMVGWVQDGN
ncbi:DUF3679 domain-containing protein [Salinithrix halophila]|uniref:DUF3679 domain-containing protein n=1 Tax=Salinithrix halophila TaxID=1485204 RepID=A0ABV8JEC7_9BACL